jgi:GT2 family glycosyltransferase/tRNA A-37 threonylcarbamoyl transferase component Bud32
VDVSVLIVNFNGGDVTPACLDSLPKGVETIVVDNGSKDGSADAIAAKFPGVVLIRNAANRGFAAAVNQAMEVARGRYFLLLNNDARLAADTLQVLVEWMDAHPDVGMAAPQLLHEDGRKQHSFDNIPSLATAFLNKSLLRIFFPSKYPSKRQDFTEPRDVASVIGACMMVRREAVERIGPLDEAYFLFLEETDWCLRCTRAGYRVVFLPQAKVVHLQGRARDKVRIRARIEYTRSLFTFFRRNRPLSYPLLRVLFPLKNLVEFLLQTLTILLKGVPQRWVETAALLGWQAALCPRGWGLSKGAEVRHLRLRDGWTVAETHLDAFSDFDAALRKARVLVDLKNKRTVEATSAGRTYRVKIYKKGGGVRKLLALLGLAPVPREPAVSVAAVRAGLPCAPVVAWGDRDFGSAIAVERIDGARDLQDVLLDPGTPRRLRRILLVRYGRFARRLQDAGLWQYDFNPTNILLDGPRMLVIDFERARWRGRPLAEAERLRLVAKMNRVPGLSRTDRLRFLRGYLDASAADRARKGEIVAALRRYAAEKAEEDVEKAGRRCFEDNRDFGPLAVEGWEGWHRRPRPDRDDPGIAAADVVQALGGGAGWRSEETGDVEAAWADAHRSGGARRPVAALRRPGQKAGRLIYAADGAGTS